MLTMLEEVVLLAVDEKTGALRSTRPYGTAYALVGAVFFDLALARKIDTDTEQIHILDRSPTGSPTLDRVLSAMSQRGDITSVRDWIEEIFSRRDDLEGEALASLIRQGILRHEKSKRLWIIDVESFPMADNRPQRDVRLRLADAILSDTIPETRDIMLVSLAESCGLLGYALSNEQIIRRRARIELLSNLETISRKVASAIGDLENTTASGNAANDVRCARRRERSMFGVYRRLSMCVDAAGSRSSSVFSGAFTCAFAGGLACSRKCGYRRSSRRIRRSGGMLALVDCSGRRLATVFNRLKQTGAPRISSAKETRMPGSSLPAGFQPGHFSGNNCNSELARSCRREAEWSSNLSASLPSWALTACS